eukprot:CAMPEP_0113718914 /NCGR_PEP_ID=MMETSP0038_2-20120614/35485_1 /TAXON_ID=2898 /ORGANISM="Cryptomonas paramecium" /LENGTH=220 /DNA_ID=CAMNT_0000647151 /DNA_START=10 /DNA_END=669 /DNA_ORIENTATION=+ /assembly_acc=CAM_ASM_000170
MALATAAPAAPNPVSVLRPSHWTSTKDQFKNGTLVKLLETSKEYQDQSSFFKATCGGGAYVIIKIERIEHIVLWSQFESKKRQMDEIAKVSPGSRGSNEQILFHGTDSDSVNKILHFGFDRSFTTTHAYGKGVYFARNSSYSCSDSYSKPASDGTKTMIIVKVLVGDFCIGKQTDRAPTAIRPGGEVGDMCDSTVNDMANPTIFVTYRDNQTYPEYVITF